MEIGLGDRISFRIIYFQTHFISKNSVQVTFMGNIPYHGLLRSLWGASDVIHNYGNTNDVIDNHQNTCPNIIRSICLPSLLFTLSTLFYCLHPPPPSPHHMLVIVRHIYYFDYRGNETDHWFASNMYSTLKESISDSLTMYTYLTKSYLKYNLKRSTSLLKARYILRQIYV